MQTWNQIDTEDEIRLSFGVFDKHQDGMINIEELKHVITWIGDKMNKEEIDKFISLVDVNWNGFV